ncbi:uncharacterized protein HD556DRAFT_1448993 [Suillus plorans]|uniref:Uncharacterized protein n=1 Tax=Suillus plorans TaxID=116603 RepID=A0A9P7DCF0_9AGAM|nr:uncharacterized protein HD556DRAFT_1448993 [Suillus plorans]KAG1787198.1 hypothetical protein HD556DRAFT_1448993 [Suillus plorans]
MGDETEVALVRKRPRGILHDESEHSRLRKRLHSAIQEPTKNPIPDVPSVVRLHELHCPDSSHVLKDMPFPAPLASNCPLLSIFGIAFTCYGFICSIHQRVIPPKRLLQHIRLPDHKKACSTRLEKNYKVAIAHILESHCVPSDMDVIPLPSAVPDLIPGLEAIFSFKCPAPNCPEWFRATLHGTNKRKQRHVMQHWSRSHRADLGDAPAFFEGRFIIRPYLMVVDSKDPLTSIVVVLPETWSPPDTPLATSAPDAPINRLGATAPKEASFLRDIKWLDYAQSLQADTAKLQALVKLPTSNEYHILHLSERQARLERGLLEVHRLYKGYLKDANQFVESCHPNIRSALTFQTHAKYRFISAKSYVTYGAPMVRTICMLVRFIHFKTRRKANAPSANKSLPAKLSLGTFTVTGNAAQFMAAKSLYQYIITAETLSSTTLLELVQDLVVVLVRHEIKTNSIMECPTDQALFLSSIRGKDLFRLASPLIGDCARLAHNFYAVIAQFSRLQSGSMAKFTPFDNASWMEETAQPSLAAEQRFEECSVDDLFSDDLSSDDSEYEEGEDVEAEANSRFELFSDESDSDSETGDRCLPRIEGETEGTFMEIINGSLHDFGIAKKKSIGSSDLLAIISEEVRFLKPMAGVHPGYSTPFDRFKGVCEDGRSLTMEDGDRQPQTFHLLQLANCAHALLTQLDSNVLLNLPSRIHNLYYEFDTSLFTDNLLEQRSIFKQARNKSLLAKVVSTAGACILTPGVIKDKKAARQWLKQWDDDVVPLIIAGFFLTCGVPPRGFQLHSMLLDQCPVTDKARNLFIINGLPALGNPVSKQRGKSVQERLWLFPQALARPFLFYLGVIRPIIQMLLRDLGCDAMYQDTHVFARALPQHRPERDLPQFWNGSDINKALQLATASLPFRLTCTALRRIITAVFHRHFPELLDSLTGTSAVDGQAQHTQQTGDTHYGRVYSAPAALGMTHENAKRYITMSKALQAAYGLGAAEESWQDIVARLPLFPTCKHHHYAFSVARQTVLQQYGLCGDTSGIKITAQTVLEDAPYINSHIVAFTSEIGDAALIQVSSAVLFGPNPPGNSITTPPPGGYLPADIARSVAFIILAIEEWADGTFQPVILAQPPGSIHFEELRTAAEKIIRKLRETNAKGWVKLSADVHAFRHPAARQFWTVRGLGRTEDEDVSVDDGAEPAGEARFDNEAR